MGQIKQYAPQVIFLLLSSTLCMTYFVQNIVLYQVAIYAVIFLLFLVCRKKTLVHSIEQCNTLFIIFACLYLFRAFVELEILGHQQELFANDATVYFSLITGMLIPAFYVSKIFSVKNYSVTFAFLSILVAICLFISLYNIFSGNIIFSLDRRIQGNESLGVIQYGHLGLTGALLGYLCLSNNDYKIFFRISSVALILAGFLTMLMAGTKGALVSAIVIISFSLIAKAKLRSGFIFLLLIVIGAFFIEDLVSLFESWGASSLTRVVRAVTEGGDQSSGRIDIWKGAVQDIMGSPILGVSCFYNSSSTEITYVHNSLIEVTYALGLFGLFVFIKLNWMAIKASYIAIKSSNIDDIAFSFLYMQYFTYTLFSESIIRVPLYWFLLLQMLNIRNRQLISNENNLCNNPNL